MPYSASTYPYKSVVEINTDLGQGSGAIIGPHTVLTCSHLLWDYQTQSSAAQITLTTGAGTTISDTNWTAHFYQIVYSPQDLPPDQSQFDFAIVDYPRDLSAYDLFQVETGYRGGQVHVTGYPSITAGAQEDQVGTVTADPTYSLLDYGTVATHPGNSGGPLWVDLGSSASLQPGAAAIAPYIVGIVSTLANAVQLTPADWDTINGWIQSDASLWSTPQHLVLSGTGNFDASGQSDLAFTSGGGVVLWIKTPSGFTEIPVTNGKMGAEWNVTKTGDFAGDGGSDVVWTEAAGDAKIWLMNGSRLVGLGTPAGRMGSEWHLSSVCDLNGDGKADMAWVSTGGQVAVWTMNGAALAGFGISNGHMGAEWSVAANGDFNGDGKQDLLWVSTTGGVATWTMNGAQLTAFNGNVGQMGGEWHVAGTGDFNGNQVADVVWVDTNNNVQVWLMSAGRIGQIVTPIGHFGTEWHLKSVADFTGDGRADLLWLTNSGAAQLWSLNGTAVSVTNLASPNDLASGAIASVPAAASAGTATTFDDLTVPTVGTTADASTSFAPQAGATIPWPGDGSAVAPLTLAAISPDPAGAVGLAVQSSLQPVSTGPV